MKRVQTIKCKLSFYVVIMLINAVNQRQKFSYYQLPYTRYLKYWPYNKQTLDYYITKQS